MCGQNSFGKDNRLLSREQALANIKSGQGGTFPSQHILDTFGWKTTPQFRSTGIVEGEEATPSRQSSGLSIQSRPSARTGSGTRVQAKAKTKARQSRTKRFTTR